MFENYPKKRPDLRKEIQDIYIKQYTSNRNGDTTASKLSQMLESWLHKKVACDNVDSEITHSTLEIGAGTLNQIPYEKKGGPYDIVEPFSSLYSNSRYISHIRNAYNDISDIPLESKYTRITSIAALEHICNLPEVVARSALMLTLDGSFRAAIPSEGTPLWGLAWKLTTGLEFRIKHGLDYGELMAHEHVNTAKEIEEVLNYFFQDVKFSKLGLSRSISIYQFFDCQKPNIERCNKYLISLKK